VFEAYRTWAVTRGVSKMMISVSLENTTANAFWLSVGFELDSTNPTLRLFGAKTHVMQDFKLDLKILVIKPENLLCSDSTQ
jgi:hypothetical protein